MVDSLSPTLYLKEQPGRKRANTNDTLIHNLYKRRGRYDDTPNIISEEESLTDGNELNNMNTLVSCDNEWTGGDQTTVTTGQLTSENEIALRCVFEIPKQQSAD